MLHGHRVDQEFVATVARLGRIRSGLRPVAKNRDAQLLALLRLEMTGEQISKLRSIRYYGGLPLDARTVTDEVVKQEGI